MVQCPHCGNHYRQLATHLRVVHGITDATPTPDVPSTVTVAFTNREWAALDALARRSNVTPDAVVRAMVQRVLAAGPPPVRDTPVAKAPKRTGYPALRRPQPRPSARAEVVTNADGQRVCPGCLTVLVKKNPHGPGRYPKYCEACR